MFKNLLAAMLVVSSLVLGGCGGDDDDSNGAATTEEACKRIFECSTMVGNLYYQVYLESIPGCIYVMDNKLTCGALEAQEMKDCFAGMTCQNAARFVAESDLCDSICDF